MGHHRFKGEHLETGAMGGQRVRVALEVAVPLCTGDNKRFQHLKHGIFKNCCNKHQAVN